eukprot:gene15396-18216_t
MAAPKTVIQISNAGAQAVNGRYMPKPFSEIPKSFAKVCKESRWPVERMWAKLADETRTWFLHDNDSYIYYNRADGKWWIDGPDGYGVYTALNSADLPPADGWTALGDGRQPLPTVSSLEL